MSLDLTSQHMLALTRASLAALRSALIRDAGPSAAAYLQEAGYAGGEQLFASFGAWLAARGEEMPPEDLTVEEFESHATEFFREAGWGSIAIGSLNDALATIDSSDWGEADDAGALEHPSCHMTTGMFADFFGRVADQPLAVLEVECRSTGAPRCRFLIGAADVMEHVYDELGQGRSVEEAVETVE
jgi:predicted hydrocarbon binding protein